MQTCVQNDGWFPRTLRDVECKPPQKIGSWSRLWADVEVRLLLKEDNLLNDL